MGPSEGRRIRNSNFIVSSKPAWGMRFCHNNQKKKMIKYQVSVLSLGKLLQRQQKGVVNLESGLQ